MESYRQVIKDMYGIETRVLKQQVRRNLDRFPIDFMFEMAEDEIEILVSQNVIPSKSTLGGAKPMAFTEQGVAMLSSVLRSPRAVQVNIAIMRAFVQMRKIISMINAPCKIHDNAIRVDGITWEMLNNKLESVARYVPDKIVVVCRLHRALGDARLVARIWIAMEGKHLVITTVSTQ